MQLPCWETNVCTQFLANIKPDSAQGSVYFGSVLPPYPSGAETVFPRLFYD